MTQDNWEKLTSEEKKQQLFQIRKQTMDLFLIVIGGSI